MDWWKKVGTALRATASVLAESSVVDYVVAAAGFSLCLCIPAIMEKFVTSLSDKIVSSIETIVVMCCIAALTSITVCSIRRTAEIFKSYEGNRHEKSKDNYDNFNDINKQITDANNDENRNEKRCKDECCNYITQNFHFACPCINRHGMECQKAEDKQS